MNQNKPKRIKIPSPFIFTTNYIIQFVVKKVCEVKNVRRLNYESLQSPVEVTDCSIFLLLTFYNIENNSNLIPTTETQRFYCDETKAI